MSVSANTLRTEIICHKHCKYYYSKAKNLLESLLVKPTNLGLLYTMVHHSSDFQYL